MVHAIDDAIAPTVCSARSLTSVPKRARSLIEAAGHPVTYRAFPEMGHFMHRIDPQLFATTVIEWVANMVA